LTFIEKAETEKNIGIEIKQLSNFKIKQKKYIRLT